MSTTVFIVFALCGVSMVTGHGRLIKPPGRSTAHRYGFGTPANYNDNQLFCGGVQVQYEQNGGRCGVCGDPASGPLENEAGGKYATGTIVAKYRPGQVIDIQVDVTANHLGWFEFRLCAVNNKNRKASQGCLNGNLLRLPSAGGATRVNIGSTKGVITTKAQLPAGLTCSQCVLQWIYNSGNSWGGAPGNQCKGCGNQEQFRGCADISIGSGGGGDGGNTNPVKPTDKVWWTPRPQGRTTQNPWWPQKPVKTTGNSWWQPAKTTNRWWNPKPTKSWWKPKPTKSWWQPAKTTNRWWNPKPTKNPWWNPVRTTKKVWWRPQPTKSWWNPKPTKSWWSQNRGRRG